MVKATTDKRSKAKKPQHRFVINCRDPVQDNIFVLSDFQQFLTHRIKVEGKTGNLANAVTVSEDRAVNRDQVVVQTSINFSKRYLKYLTKKYLKQQDLREYLRVIATNKNTYEVKFINVQDKEEDAE